MSRSYVGAGLRRLVARRAAGFCEYCLIHADDTFFGCEVDHVIAEKHGGATVAANLALACVVCNRRKGSDVGSIDRDHGGLVRFYHPRRDRWLEQFELTERTTRIEGRTDVGAATARVLAFNATERLLEREALVYVGRFPPPPQVLETAGRDATP